MTDSGARTGRRRFIATSGAAITGLLGTRTATALPNEVRNAFSGRQQSLQVLSYNIHHGEGTDGVYDLRRIADVIRTVEPDIVALQEVDKGYHVPWRESSRSDLDDQPTLLADWLGMNAEYFVHIDYTGTESFEEYGEANGQYGDLILSTYPIVEAESYPFRVTDEEKGYLQNEIAATKINAQGSHFWFYSVHPNAFDAEINEAQQKQLIETTRRKELPQIVAGDFNARYGIGSNPRQKGYELLNDAFVDVLRQTGDDEYTIPTPGTDGNKRRLDYIFTTEEIDIVSGNVVTTGIPSPSDHRAITADLVLTRGQNGTPN